MSVLFVVLPVALAVAAAAVIAFVWAVRSGQLDDLETPALRVLHDEEAASDGDGPASGAAGGDEARDPAPPGSERS